MFIISKVFIQSKDNQVAEVSKDNIAWLLHYFSERSDPTTSVHCLPRSGFP